MSQLNQYACIREPYHETDLNDRNKFQMLYFCNRAIGIINFKVLFQTLIADIMKEV